MKCTINALVKTDSGVKLFLSPTSDTLECTITNEQATALKLGGELELAPTFQKRRGRPPGSGARTVKKLQRK